MDSVKVIVCLFGSKPVYTQGCIEIAKHVYKANKLSLDDLQWNLTVCHDDTVPEDVLAQLKDVWHALWRVLRDC